MRSAPGRYEQPDHGSGRNMAIDSGISGSNGTANNHGYTLSGTAFPNVGSGGHPVASRAGRSGEHLVIEPVARPLRFAPLVCECDLCRTVAPAGGVGVSAGSGGGGASDRPVREPGQPERDERGRGRGFVPGHAPVASGEGGRLVRGWRGSLRPAGQHHGSGGYQRLWNLMGRLGVPPLKGPQP